VEKATTNTRRQSAKPNFENERIFGEEIEKYGFDCSSSSLATLQNYAKQILFTTKILMND